MGGSAVAGPSSLGGLEIVVRLAAEGEAAIPEGEAAIPDGEAVIPDGEAVIPEGAAAIPPEAEPR